MSEPTIRLPLRISEAWTGRVVDTAGDFVPLPDVVSLVNSQAERIRGLRGVLDQALSLASNPYWMEKSESRQAIIKVITAALEERDNG